MTVGQLIEHLGMLGSDAELAAISDIATFEIIGTVMTQDPPGLILNLKQVKL